MTNKKAQTPITIMFWFLIAIIIWAVFAAPILTTWGHGVTLAGGYTGIEALFYDNLNFVIGIVLIMGLLGVGYFASSQ